MDCFDAAKEINEQCIVYRLPFHLVKDKIKNLDASAKLRARETCKLFQDVKDLHCYDIANFCTLRSKPGDIEVLREMLVEKPKKFRL